VKNICADIHPAVQYMPLLLFSLCSIKL